MPELPEVEIVCQGLNQVTLAQSIVGGVVLLSRSIAHPFSGDEFLAALKGKTITHWQRRGKYLLGELTPSDQCDQSSSWLGVHLRMSGQLLWVNSGEPLQKHTRVRLFFPGDRELRFVDQRTFGRLWWVPPNTQPERIMTGLNKLGREPFDPTFSVPYLVSKLQTSQRSIKTVLLDQSLVAGVGNIYADEALFLSGIRPETPSSHLTLAQIERLHPSILQVLQAGIEAGGTTFSHFMNVQGVNGNYHGVAWVYGRTGEPCRVCGTPIQRLKLNGRSAHFCPNCQT